MNIRTALAIAPFFVVTAVLADTPAPPRTAAFVVGIEHYDNTDLDKLEFAADDARRFWDQLKVVTALDEKKSVPLFADDMDKSRVTAEQIRTAMQKFVQKLDHNLNVIVYLGGHGTLSDAESLWYLPSDYNPDQLTGYVSFDELRTMIREKIAGRRKLSNVKVVFLVNTCGAGNAAKGNMSAKRPAEEADELARILGEENYGVPSYAVLPAAEEGRDTQEKQEFGGSIFAHYLLDGLTGPAAENGVITTRSLFNHVSKFVPRLPWNAGFDANIIIGVTRKLEGEGEFAVGSALLATARSLDDGERDSMRESHHKLLLELAEQSFGRVAARAPELKVRALLRSSQIAALQGKSLSVAPQNVSKNDLALADVKALGALLNPDPGPDYIALGALHDKLVAGEPFYALLLEGRMTSAPAAQHLVLAEWQKTFEQFSGRRDIQTMAVSITTRTPTPLTAMEGLIRHWKEENSNTGQPARLFLLYTGSVMSRGELLPIGVREIRTLLSEWSGPATIIHLSRGGGYLRDTQFPHEKTSLLLASTDKRIYSVPTRGDDRVAQLLAGAFAVGADPLSGYALLAEAYKSKTVSHPVWIPVWNAPTQSAIAGEQVAPLGRFALHAAAECINSTLQDCDAIVMGRIVPPETAPEATDPFRVLTKAAELDIAGEEGQAIAQYRLVAKALRAAEKLTTKQGISQILAKAVEPIERRAARDEDQHQRIVVLGAAVFDYASPWIADLPDPAPDFAAYERAIRAVLKSNQVVEVINISPKTASELKEAIAAQRGRLGPQDLLVFIYSGRGLDSGGRRYLTTSGTSVCEVDEGQDSPCVQVGWNETVDLWDIAQQMRDRSLVAIYDAQFSSPRLDPDRFDAVGDKHVHSVRPLPLRTQTVQDDDELQESPTGDYDVWAREKLPAGQLHIWANGTVTATADSCTGEDIVSHVAGALIEALPDQRVGTYRTWLKTAAASPCLQHEETNEVVARFSVQGNPDVPVFASGDAAELIDYFRKDEARGSVNLYAAEDVIGRVANQFPSAGNRIAHAALLIALALFHDTSSAPLSEAERKNVIDRAIRLSEQELASAASGEMKALVLELVTQGYVLLGDPASARLQLSKHPELLSHRRLARRLADVTYETVRLQPVKLIRETLITMISAPNNSHDSGLSEAATSLRELLEHESTRHESTFTIAPP